MKFRIALTGIVFCLGALAQGQTATQTETKSTQSANRMKKATPTAQQSLTGCVDQQNGHYVMRDTQTSQVVGLQSPSGDDDTWFARYVGHQVQADGAKSSDSMKVTQIHQVADMCGTGK
jgi:hypothetical protein